MRVLVLGFAMAVGGGILIGAAPLAQQVPEPAPSKLIVQIQQTCQVGELVRMDARKSEVGGIVWRILPETLDFEVIDNGRRALFSARAPGEYLVIVAGAAGDQPFLAHHYITVRGSPTPPQAAELTDKIAAWFLLVKTPDRLTEAKELAAVFRIIANTNELEVSKILEATAVANREVLGESLEGWIPFLEQLGNELDAYTEAGKLNTREQYRSVWEEIADGLEQAR